MNISHYHTSNKFQGLEKDTIVMGFYIEDFAYDHAGNVWVKAIPMSEFNSGWDQDTFDSLLRVYIIPSSLKGHWRYNQ